MIYGQPLTPEQKDGLRNGEKVDFTLEVKDGKEKDLVMYYSPTYNKIRFIDKSLQKPIDNKKLKSIKIYGVNTAQEQKQDNSNQVKI